MSYLVDWLQKLFDCIYFVFGSGRSHYARQRDRESPPRGRVYVRDDEDGVDGVHTYYPSEEEMEEAEMLVMISPYGSTNPQPEYDDPEDR